MQEIKVGQIWREVDPRFNRFIRRAKAGCGIKAAAVW
jgi:hypothetical protein